MARPRKIRQLAVWMNGQRVGTWALTRPGGDVFTYHETWQASPVARPLSLSMPLRPDGAPYRGAVVEAFFDNLLPDSRELRQRIQSRFRTPSLRAFDLLAEIGRDCVGAVQLLPEDTPPQGWNRIEGERLDDAGVAAVLRTIPVVGDTEVEGFRISLAGAQEKTALLWHAGAWHRPVGATPTTHIFKLPLGRVGRYQVDLGASVENEWLCAQIARAYGLAVANCEIARFEDRKALVVERFDRRLAREDTYFLRLPQEDMCQALGVPAAFKYEADGGPGIKAVMDLLLGSTHAGADRRAFFKTQVLLWMLCATDGHAKNYSVAILPQGRYRLTPLYDLLSAWPVIGHRANRLPLEKATLAMAVLSRHRHYRWSGIQRRHWLSTARATGLDEPTAQRVISDLVSATPDVIHRIAARLPDRFPHSVSGPVLHGLAMSAKKLITTSS